MANKNVIKFTHYDLKIVEKWLKIKEKKYFTDII